MNVNFKQLLQGLLVIIGIGAAVGIAAFFAMAGLGLAVYMLEHL